VSADAADVEVILPRRERKRDGASSDEDEDAAGVDDEPPNSSLSKSVQNSPVMSLRRLEPRDTIGDPKSRAGDIIEITGDATELKTDLTRLLIEEDPRKLLERLSGVRSAAGESRGEKENGIGLLRPDEPNPRVEEIVPVVASGLRGGGNGDRCCRVSGSVLTLSCFRALRRAAAGGVDRDAGPVRFGAVGFFTLVLGFKLFLFVTSTSCCFFGRPTDLLTSCCTTGAPSLSRT